jgi:hypothetical protein
MRGGRTLFRRFPFALHAAFALVGMVGLSATAQSESKPQIAVKPATKTYPNTSRAATATERLINDARDGRLDDFTFLSAALTASGAETADDAKKWLAMYEPVRAGILSRLPPGTATDRLKAIHADTYQLVLTGAYQESCSDLRKTFSVGDFNCLTSLAVCFDLSQSAGLVVHPILIRGHVFLAYKNGSGQTQFFEPGAGEWQSHPLIEVTVGRTLSPSELLGKFYYNRGVEHLRSRSYQDGLSLLRVSLALDPADEDARANLVAGLNNWAVAQCQARRYDEAASLIQQGLALDPTFAPLIANEQFLRAKLGQ